MKMRFRAENFNAHISARMERVETLIQIVAQLGTVELE